MLEKSYITLELPAVLEMLAAQAESELGKAAARELQPSANKEEVRRRLTETSDAARILRRISARSDDALSAISSSAGIEA